MIVSLNNLTVRYGRFTALNGVTGEIPEGCVGLLGPNGAGKTTLLKTLLGFVKPAGGSATVLGQDVVRAGRELRQLVGLMPEQDCHIPGLSAVSFVAFAGELAGMPSSQALRRAHEVLEYCGLGEARYRDVETFSTGMRQRIKLAQAIIHGPKLLLLDEPTNGLDPRGREEMLELIRSISHGKGVHVLISSHLLPDVERVSDVAIVLVSGQIRAIGRISDLKRIEGRPVDVELREANEAFVAKVVEMGGEVKHGRAGAYRIRMDGTPDAILARLFDLARATHAQIRGFQAAERSLEDAFLQAVAPPPKLDQRNV
jgi:ABC-2 type transport system ATP-binding protein